MNKAEEIVDTMKYYGSLIGYDLFKGNQGDGKVWKKYVIHFMHFNIVLLSISAANGLYESRASLVEIIKIGELRYRGPISD